MSFSVPGWIQESSKATRVVIRRKTDRAIKETLSASKEFMRRVELARRDLKFKDLVTNALLTFGFGFTFDELQSGSNI